MKFLSVVTTVISLASSVNGLSDYAKNNVRKEIGNKKFVTVPVDQLTKARDLLGNQPYDYAGVEGGALHMSMDPESAKMLEKAGINLNDVTEKTFEAIERGLQTEMFCQLSDEECAALPSEEFYTTYQRLPALFGKLDTIAESDLAFIEDIGTSFEGRPLRVINVAKEEGKPLVFLTCNIHAREWIPPILCTYLAEQLVGDGVTGHPLLEDFSFALLISQNPDGYVFTYETNPNWRKTRKPNFFNPSCIGTDANRNYDSFWAGDGTSNDPCSDVYHGHSPFDQPETAAVRDYVHRADIKSRLISFHDVHSYGSYWLYPWSGIFELPPPDVLYKQKECSEAAWQAIIDTHGEVFTIGPSADTLYVAAGVSDDYMFESLGLTFADTIEVRSGGEGGFEGFRPDPENILLASTEVLAGLEAHLACIYGFELSDTPTEYVCKNWNPNGIVYVDGSPAECDDLADFCDVYAFVNVRCPVTCDSCEDIEIQRAANAQKHQRKVKKEVVRALPPVKP